MTTSASLITPIEAKIASVELEAAPTEPKTAPTEPNRFLARQPILDRQRKVIGYELLFRSGWANGFSGEADDATRKMLDNVLVSGSDSLCGQTLAFVNCTRDSLVNRLVTLLPPASTVLEILETVKPDKEVVTACYQLKSLGYRLALDDFVDVTGLEPLIELADYIKLDFRASDRAAREAIRAGVARATAAFVAEKVEDEAEFDAAVSEGFSYFQGYFFCRPMIVARHEVEPNALNALRLLTALSRTPMNLGEIELVVMADSSLCYRLLRMVNSPLYAIRKQVESIRRALIIVGENEFRKLALVAMAGGMSKRQPHALLSLSLQRARFCELAAARYGQNPTEQYLIGLLSLVDAILQLPMAMIVDSLPLRPTTRSALLGEQNAEAVPLSVACRYETGHWTPAPEPASEQLTHMYAESVRWADDSLRSTSYMS